MAEKVTLKKPDGTIIYPQTQVDTQEIYDDAVTAAKIDWTSLSGAPIAVKDISMGYQCTGHFIRVGNIVFGSWGNPVWNAASSGSSTTIPQSADNLSTGKTVPLGYRPANNTISITANATVGNLGSVAFLVATDGTVRYNAALNSNGGARFGGVWAYPTKDAFPSGDIVS